MGFRVWGFRVWGFGGLGVWGFRGWGFGVWWFRGLGVWRFRLVVRVSGLGFRVLLWGLGV